MPGILLPCALSLIADITDHKLAEKTLAEVGRKLIQAHEEERTADAEGERAARR